MNPPPAGTFFNYLQVLNRLEATPVEQIMFLQLVFKANRRFSEQSLHIWMIATGPHAFRDEEYEVYRAICDSWEAYRKRLRDNARLDAKRRRALVTLEHAQRALQTLDQAIAAAPTGPVVLTAPASTQIAT